MALNGAVFFHCYVWDVLWRAPNDSGVPYVVVAGLAFAAFVKASLALRHGDHDGSQQGAAVPGR